ncbi:MAG TPA: PEPxxWA-CTERM sorting domain-containing protein [Caulobacteraceae bacterium]|nr:PEPxxWA-CTERM sorting domain-containing protein [Caulobacteraceae bacterium]
MHSTLLNKGAAVAAGLALIPLMLGGAAHAGAIVYHVDQTIGDGSVVGFIKTDGATGTLGALDITSWNLSLNGVGASFDLTPLNSHVLDRGVDVTATTADLFFNFSGGDGGRLLFQTGGEDGEQYYCDATSLADCYQGATVAPITIFDASEQHVPEEGNQIIGVAGGVPEPATWAMFLAGFTGLGAMLRRRQTAVRAAAA